MGWGEGPKVQIIVIGGWGHWGGGPKVQIEDPSLLTNLRRGGGGGSVRLVSACPFYVQTCNDVNYCEC